MSFLDHVSFHCPKEHLLVWCFAFLSVFVVRGIFSLKVEAGSGTVPVDNCTVPVLFLALSNAMFLCGF